jgi:hypothetical protein
VTLTGQESANRLKKAFCLPTVLPTRQLPRPGDLGGAITEAQGNGIPADGTIVVGYGTNTMGKPAFLYEVAMTGERAP